MPNTAAAEGETAPAPAKQKVNRPVAILIAEDSEDDLGLILRALRRGGFEPTCRRVQSTVELQTALAEERWDAVFSDFSMPGFTGLDALRLFRATGIDIPFILISGTIGEEIAVEAMKAGASDYIMKQSLARLAPALERELREAKMRAAHRQAQRALVESEQRLRTMIETEPECVKVVSREGALLEMNPAGLAMLEAGSLAEVQARSLLDFIVPEHRAAFTALHQRVIGGTSGVLEFEVIGLKGGRRWLETHAAPLEGTGAGGPVLLGVTRDITGSKRASDELLRFRAAMDFSADAIFLIDPASMRYLDVNRTACEMAGRTREEMLLGKTPMDLTGRTRQEHDRDYRALMADSPNAGDRIEGTVRRADGSVIQVETRRRALRTESGWIIVGTSRDIAERKAAEDRIVYLNRVYAMLSGINQLIVRVRERDELFREACRVAVEEGGFRTAWIGIVDQGAKKIVPIASTGASEGFLATLSQALALPGSEPLGDSLTARAAREKKIFVSNDSQNDPRVALGRSHASLGTRSIVILPLVVREASVGVLVLHAGEVDYFHAEEMKLLTDLAGDIAFAVDHIANQERLEYLAYYDVLTGLANRSLFLERVAQYMRSAALAGHGLAVFFIDVERFKNINESLGRAAGDALLKQVGEFMTAGEDPNLVARLGADHFAMVMPVVRSDGDVTHLAAKRIESFREHLFTLNDAAFRLAVKVGIALYPDGAADADALLRNAEAALKNAKVRGERCVLYNQSMLESGAGKLTLENKLRSALANEEFVLHYQPKVSLRTGRITGAEALIRWNDPQTGIVPPGRFIPILEETGLIHDVGRWALRRALEDYVRWRAAGLPAVRIAVNVSPLQLRDRGFIAEVAQAIGVDASAPEGLELEITESLVMMDVKHSIASLKAIREMKVTVAIDDFGTGFSSLAYLSKLPVDTLKIDRSFVIDLTTGPDGLSLVSTIINLAHALKLKVVAEGVETEGQSSLLKLLNCDEMQGFLFSRAVPAGEFEAKFLRTKTGRAAG